MDKALVEIILLPVRRYLLYNILFKDVKVLNGRLPIHFVGYDKKWDLFGELSFFECRYLTPPRQEFYTWIYRLNLKSLSPLGALKCLLLIIAFPLLASNFFASGLGDSWIISPGNFFLFPRGVYLPSTRLLGKKLTLDLVTAVLVITFTTKHNYLKSITEKLLDLTKPVLVITLTLKGSYYKLL